MKLSFKLDPSNLYTYDNLIEWGALQFPKLCNQNDFLERELTNFRRNALYEVQSVIAALNERIAILERDRKHAILCTHIMCPECGRIKERIKSC